MKELKFRNIKKEEIDLRVGATKKEDKKDEKTGKPILDQSGKPIKEVVGFQLLGYKDARVDATILDETVGVSNWACKYYQVKNTMICSVGINVNYDEPNKEPLWVWKDDAGDESNEEAIKGEASDSFKRGCFRWGVCRTNLYNLPFIWIKATKENTPYARYVVADIEFDEKGYPIKLLIINDKTKEQVFSYGVKGKQAYNEPKQAKESKVEFEDKHSVSSKEVSNSIKSMEDYEKEYQDPLGDSEDRKYLKDYYETLSDEGKQKFDIWLFTNVNETKINKLNELQVSGVARAIKNKVAKELEKKAGNQ